VRTESLRPFSTGLEPLLASWLRSLRARNVSPATLTTYRTAAEQLVTFLAERDITRAADVDRAAVEEWIGHLLDTRSAATASNRYRAIQQWFAWMVEEDELAESPTARMKPPHVPEQDVEVLAVEQIRALLKVCEGRDFTSRRDTAIIRLFADTGMRLAELAGLRLDDVDLDSGAAAVLGKGRRPRTCPFGARTAQSLDRYLRVRAAQRGANATDALWLAEQGRGAMQSSGIAQMLKRRGLAAGIAGLHTRRFRCGGVVGRPGRSTALWPV
jgi:integrase/recombinase XerC